MIEVDINAGNKKAMAEIRDALAAVPGLNEYVCALAAKAMVDDIVRDKKAGEDMLRSVWAVVTEGISKSIPVSKADPGFLSSVLLLNEYFSHRGDFDAMCKCLEGAAAALEEKHGLSKFLKVEASVKRV
jgi:hypothetical protein